MHGPLEHGRELNGAEVDDQTLSPNPRRIRHITSIQIRNLTPFPVRDAFASALKQPSEQPQFTAHGHLSDDLDVTLGRKRSRRTSTTSVASLAGHKVDGEGDGDHSNESGMRKRAMSKASISSGPGSIISSSPKLSRRLSSAGAPTVRPPHRQRTISMASSVHSRTGSMSQGIISEPGTSSSAMFPGLLRDTSQAALEKVLQSRLVETFVTVTLLDPPPCSPITNGVHQGEPEASSSRSSTPPTKPSPSREKVPIAHKLDSTSRTAPRRSTITAASNSLSSHRPATPSRRAAPPSTSTSSRNESSTAHGKSASLSLPSSKTSKTPSSLPARKQRPTIPSSLTSPSLSSFPAKSERSTPSPDASPRPSASPGSSTLRHDECQTPDYISPIHRPSTNPSFQLDARSCFEFAPDADLSGSKMRVQVWGYVKRGEGWASAKDGSKDGKVDGKPKGRVDSKGKTKECTKSADSKETGSDPKGKGKEREDARNQVGKRVLEWKVLEEWNVDLNDLTPLPKDLASHPSHLPSNTLLLQLSPPGRTFYLPSVPLHLQTPSPLAQSSTAGYNSDPESEARKVRGGEEFARSHVPRKTSGVVTSDTLDVDSPEDVEEQETLMRKGRRRTANWQDLFKLINLQTCILDTQQSLSSVVRGINEIVTQPGVRTLTREVAEREAWVGQLCHETEAVLSEAQQLKSRLNARKEDLRRRKEMLTLARESNVHDTQEWISHEEEVSEERECLSSLRSQLPPMRSILIATLSSIYPIDLLSPPDLLYSILDVPLPMPLTPTDPAPPLSLPSHKGVTEETVATALGYAAQVIQLLAAYLGKGLVYPVTCVGSRSLIKDGISAMVGPRMFPLFSKGVDTYRFEYGVFLLNKDIEMLMTDRNLRVPDMRYTLFNLKNLLLTLTDNEHVRVPTQRFSTNSSASISSLQSPVLTASALPSETLSPNKPDGLPPASTDASVLDESPPMSGATTPTRPTSDLATTSRKSRPFLDLAPFAGFLRSRYPSSSRPSVKSVLEVPENAQEGGSSDATPAPPNGDAQARSRTADEASGNGDDEDDRRTIRGRGDMVEEEGKVTVNGNGLAAPAEDDTGHEKVIQHGERAAVTTLVSGVS
ncbi:hypothetical protein AcW1_000225 [Taiwanofungus camphoratus]|nr:hypothetical protein AcW2_001281 [Antrodia cinnamomea]KAI0935802.1 hypothetical protein AcV5_004123 [Antrodia cinnamomea]KAI0963020.1 hypothetical protein AcW1_000225 [Antrodia cinnamomea]KAI0963022.1 hypothetical protein AcW1_000225 [Antrodia cinnamomea]